jgi:hypothetical protein
MNQIADLRKVQIKLAEVEKEARAMREKENALTLEVSDI